MRKYQIFFYIAIFVFTLNCSAANERKETIKFGENFINMLFDGKTEDSYALYTEKAQKEFSKEQHQNIVDTIQKLGNYNLFQVKRWLMRLNNQVPFYQIDVALKYPKFTQYVRMILTKERDQLKVINIRFISEENYKKMIEEEKMAENQASSPQAKQPAPTNQQATTPTTETTKKPSNQN